MMTLYSLICVGVFIAGAALAFLSFDKREYLVTKIAIAVMLVPLVMTYNLYQTKIIENAKYEARQ